MKKLAKTLTVRLIARYLRLRCGAAPARPSLAGAKSILVIRLDDIGDIVLSSPFFRELRRLAPQAHIALAVKKNVAPLIEHCPYINQHVVLPEFRGEYRGLFGRVQRLQRFLRDTLSHRPDLALVPRFDADLHGAAFAAAASGARARVGFGENVTTLKAQTNAGYDSLFTHLVPADGVMHEVLRSLTMLEFLGGTVTPGRCELWLTPDDHGFAERLSQNAPGPRIAVCTGAASPRRRWPLENFRDALAALRQKYPDLRAFIVGGPADKPDAHALRHDLGDWVIPLAGESTLRQSAGVIAGCHLMLGNDSGPVHLAAGAGVPIVCICCHPKTGDPGHYNAPARFGPWGGPARILQPDPAGHCRENCVEHVPHCIRNISVSETTAAAIDLLATNANLPPRAAEPSLKP